MTKKFAGKKITGSHTTVIDAAEKIISEILKDDSVEKISLGIIRQCRTRSGYQKIKIIKIPVGLKMVIRGNSYAQTIYLYIYMPERNNDLVSKKIQNITSK